MADTGDVVSHGDGRMGDDHPSAIDEKEGQPQALESAGNGSDDNSNSDVSLSKKKSNMRSDGKIELREQDCYELLGYSYPTWKKWSILSVIFAVQVSMNFNTSIYANGIMAISEQYGVSGQAARVGQMIFLVAYAFASELWAPWSEESIGRWKVLQTSLFFVNIWQILCALAPNFGSLIVGRFLGGLSSAGGSVTLGVVADMWEPDHQQYAVAFIVFSSVGGSVLAPIVGGYIGTYLDLVWIFWIQLIFGGVVQFMHFWVPETRSTIIVNREAKRRRAAGESNVYGPYELRESAYSTREILTTWTRPFVMFVTEPIVGFLSLLSGFSDALIFTFLESYMPVYTQWGFSTPQVGLAFIPILVGYFIAWALFIPSFRRHGQIRAKDPAALQPESRLYLLLFLAPLEPIGLLGFAWTSLGPPRVHWIAPMIFSALVGIANYAIYMATIDYMVAAYGPYSASATGGNALSRDFLAGVAAMYATPMYTNIGTTYHLEWASTLLGVLAIGVCIPVYIFYWKGPVIRAKSKFAQTLASDRKARGEEGSRFAVQDDKEKTGQVEDVNTKA